MPDNLLDPRRKRLLWRASHRGIREMDIVLGRFAESRIATMGEADLRELEAIIDIPDQDLFAWLTGGSAPDAARTKTLDALLAFRP
jgi:antitoxin CptB